MGSRRKLNEGKHSAQAPDLLCRVAYKYGVLGVDIAQTEPQTGVGGGVEANNTAPGFITFESERLR